MGKANVMGLRRSAAAYEARFVGDEGKVSLIADALLLRKSQLTWLLRLAGIIVLPFPVALVSWSLTENHLTRPDDATGPSIVLPTTITLAAREGLHPFLQGRTDHLQQLVITALFGSRESREAVEVGFPEGKTPILRWVDFARLPRLRPRKPPRS